MKIGSLFSGIGGLELGLERAGLGPTLWQVEADPFCRSVLAKHWPDAERYDDVRTFDPAGALPVDLICGGFPWQDISEANTDGAGLDGERSGLWFEMLRIVRSARPRIVVVENVPRLVRRGLGKVVGGLADAGYAVEGSLIQASDVGAPHRRERLFLVAYADQARPQIRQGSPGVLGRKDRPTVVGGGWQGGVGPSATRAEPGVGGGVDGLSRWLDRTRWPAGRGRERVAYWRPGGRTWVEPDRVAPLSPTEPRRSRIQALGNAVCPQVAYVVGMRIQQVLSGNKK